MWFFLLLSLAGLVASALAHFSTYFGVDPHEVSPWIMGLHVGIFVVFIPAVVIQKDRWKGASRQKRKGPGWKELFPYAPDWMHRAMMLIFVYAIVNFVVFMIQVAGASGGEPERTASGTYFLRPKGKNATTLPITAEEYHARRALLVRGFSGHWMIFYGASVLAMTSAIRERSANRHVVFADEFAAHDQRPDTAPVSPPRVFQLEYGSQQRYGLPIWLHATLVIVATGIGWLGGPVLMVTLVFRLLPKQGAACVAVPLFFGSAIGFAILLSSLVKRYVPARCPSCGKRAFYVTAKPLRYRCRCCQSDHGT